MAWGRKKKPSLEDLDWPAKNRITRAQFEWPFIEEVWMSTTNDGSLLVRADISTRNANAMRWYAERLNEAADFLDA